MKAPRFSILAFMGPSVFCAAPAKCVDPGPARVFVTGFVERPGAVAFTPELSIRDALVSAGYQGRKMDRIALVRNNRRIRLPVAEVWSGKIKGPKLRAGDLIQVPELGPDPEAVTIIRGSKRIQVTKQDLRSGESDPKIQPNDLVFVP